MLFLELNKKKRYIPLIILSLLLLNNTIYSLREYIFQDKNWIYNNQYNNSYCNYRYNAKKLLARGNENKITFEEGSVWGIVYENAGLAQMINTDIPIINIGQSADNKYTKELLDSKLKKATHIYSLVDALEYDNFIKALNKYNYRIIDLKYAIDSEVLCSNNSFLYIFEIEKGQNNKTKSDEFKQEISYDNPNIINNMMIGISKYRNNFYEKDSQISIFGVNNNIEEKIGDVTVSKDGKMSKIIFNISEYSKIILRSDSDDLSLMTIYEIEKSEGLNDKEK